MLNFYEINQIFFRVAFISAIFLVIFPMELQMSYDDYSRFCMLVFARWNVRGWQFSVRMLLFATQSKVYVFFFCNVNEIAHKSIWNVTISSIDCVSAKEEEEEEKPKIKAQNWNNLMEFLDSQLQ